MILPLLLITLMGSASHAGEIPAGTKVILTEAYPDPEGSPARKCGELVAGKEGVVVASPMNGDEYVDVKWNGWRKECGRHEHDTYISPAKLQIKVADKVEATKKPAPPPVSKDCKDGPHSDTMEELLHKTDLADQSVNKSEDEIDKYIACYYVGDHNDYISKFKPMIETAAEDFNVDASLMKCLILRESQYDPMDMSCSCATGLGQQVTQNIDEINKWVGDSRSRVLSGAKAKNEIARSWDDYMRELNTKNPALLAGCSRNFQKSGEVKDPNDPFYKKMISHREKSCKKDPKPCPAVYREDDRRCGAASIAATAAYLSLIDKVLARAVACHQIEWWQVDDSRIALALAYNAGEGTAQEALKLGSNQALMSANILDFSKVKKDKKTEMWGHFRALQNCLQKGNYGSPAVGTPEKRACFGLKPETTASRVSR